MIGLLFHQPYNMRKVLSIWLLAGLINMEWLSILDNVAIYEPIPLLGP